MRKDYEPARDAAVPSAAGLKRPVRSIPLRTIMERRYQQRKALDLDVVLSDRQGQVGAFKARNLSVGGIYIEIGPVDLCVGDLLNVSCFVDCHKARADHLRGIVVHHTGTGVGVMFRDYDSSSLKIMEALWSATLWPSRERGRVSNASASQANRIEP